MAVTRNLRVVISGDASSLNRALHGAGGELGKFGTVVKGATAGMGGLVAAGGYLVKQYEESAKVGRQTTAVIKSTGGAAGVSAKQVSDLATAISNKSGIDDEAIASGENLLLTFTKIRNETGKGNDVFNRATQVITDMSVALGQDMKSSAIQVGKALNDPVKGVTALQRVGVSFTSAQKDQIKTLVDTGHAMDAQKLILRELNKEFGGSAAAAATPFDKLKVTMGNLAETLGGYLAPAAEKVASAINKFVLQMQDGTGAGGRFAKAVVRDFDVMKTAVGAAIAAVKSAVTTVRSAISNFVARNRREIAQVGQAFENIGAIIKSVFNGFILPTIRRLLPAFKQIFAGSIQLLHGFIEVFTGIFTGDFGKMWRGIKDIFGGGIKAAFGVVRAQTAAARELASQIGSAIAKGIVSGLSGLGHMILQKVKDSADFVTKNVGGFFKGVGHAITHPLGDGIGRQISLDTPGGGTFPAGKGSGSLMGAQSTLAPFAAAASRFGLSVSSGRRPGAITSSNNVSYHSSGEAIDLADGRGPDANKLSFFRYMKQTFGPRLAELIYTPGGVGIKDGHPFTYTGKVAADHFDHVHVALDTGRPGVGDGHGKSGIAVAVDAARKAGFSGTDLVNMVAIAARESGYDPTQHNPVPPDDSWGLWQINVRPEANPKYRTWKLTDPYVNARAARELFLAGGYSPWKGAHGSWHDGVTSDMIDAARKAVVASRGSSSGGASGGAGTPSVDVDALRGKVAHNQDTIDAIHTQIRNLPAGKKSSAERKRLQNRVAALQTQNRHIRQQISDAPKEEETVTPYAARTDALTVSAADAGATPGTADDISVQRQQRALIASRIKKVRKALKHHLSPAKRQALSQELAGLISDHTALGGSIAELKALDPNTGLAIEATDPVMDSLNADASNAALSPDLADDLSVAGRIRDEAGRRYNAALASKDPQKIKDAADAFKAATDNFGSIVDQMKTAADKKITDWFDADLALATLTPDTKDDQSVLRKRIDFEQGKLNAARAAGDPVAIAQWAGALKSDTDALASLTAAVDDSNQQRQALIDLTKQQVDNQNKLLAFAQQGPQVMAAIVAAVSGDLGGKVGLGYQSVGVAGQLARY